MPIGVIEVPYGNVSNVFVLSVSLTPSQVAATTAAQQTFTISGLQVGDVIADVSYQGAWTVAVSEVNYWVPSNNTIGISYYNSTASGVTPPSGSYWVTVLRPAAGQVVNIIQ